MTDSLRIALAQINQIMGDIDGNLDAMLNVRSQVRDADLVVFPELALIGYPPEDLVLKPALQQAAVAGIEKLAAATADGGPAMLVGTCWPENGKLYNAVALLDGGRIAAVTRKHDLPNYGVFDEKRVFTPGPLPGPISFKGVRLGIPICEDIWTPDVCECLSETGAEILISPNGSPFEVGKDEHRLQHAIGRVTETGLPFIYLNRLGGQDELVFDGGSFILNGDCSLALQMPDWEEKITITDWTRTENGWRCAKSEIAKTSDGIESVYRAMVLGLHDYVTRNRFPGVVLGMSGGIDSALSAAVAVDALGADKVWCVMMPSRFTSSESLEDAAACATRLGVRLDTIAIEPAVTAFEGMLGPVFGDRGRDITEENIQSRVRGLTLMALSNKFGHMVLTTGNKSEMSTGYATLYGDMCGGYSVLKDVYKTMVFDLCRWRNANLPGGAMGPAGEVIPDRIITKPPTAELREDQKDEDSLPPYPVLDAILRALVEEEASVEAIAARGYDFATVARVERLLYVAEYKRRQSPPGVKITPRNFGRDRRYPITNAFRTAR